MAIVRFMDSNINNPVFNIDICTRIFAFLGILLKIVTPFDHSMILLNALFMVSGLHLSGYCLHTPERCIYFHF